MTCKKSFYNKDDILFQKKLTSGDFTPSEDNYYSFWFNAEDTNNLDYGEYALDFEIVMGNLKRTRTLILELTKETTWANNE